MIKNSNKDGSYLIDSFSENKDSEVNRLKYQVDLFYQREFALYKKIGLKDGMKIIECGSGPGFLIGNIAKDLPQCNATALEIDTFLVEQLKKNSNTNGKKLFEVKQASIYDTELPENYFDFALARLVIEHLNDPARAISEVRRILKPEGKLVIISNDFAYHLLTDPPIPELDEMYNAYIKSRFSEGGNPLVARQLPVLMRKEKFDDISMDVICVHNELEGDKSFLKAENVNISKSLVKGGFLKKETLESLIENWYKMLQQPDHVIFRQLFAVSGVKDANMENNNDSINEIDLCRPENQSLNIDDLTGLTSADQGNRIGSYIIDRVKKIMEQPQMDINTDTKLNDIDIDSIAAAELSSIVKSDFNTNIGISDILQRYSIREITDQILNNLNSAPLNNTEDFEPDAENRWLEGQL
ncbi:MAG: methyltransferase domain-containing protein [Bacteroidetes bacterium]|nr:methyltransferase domain-containing protein [Bacteroidota bacterium]